MSIRQLPWKRFSLVFFPLAGLTTLAFISLYQAELKTIQALAELSEKDSLTLLKEEICDEFDAIQSALLFLSRHQALKDLLAGTGSEQRLAQDYVIFLGSRERYDQIRLLDLQGKEWVRVNFNGGQPNIVPPQQLQNKEARDYFQKALQLQPGEIYLSPLNLNTERGLIEQPLKPTVRAIIALFDKQRRKQGILVLNYRGSHLLDKLRLAVQSTKKVLWLVKGSGLWLWKSNAGQKQGAIYLEKDKQAFAVAYPEIWARIQQNKEGQFYAREELFTYTTITPLVRTSPRAAKLYSSIHWKLISRLPLPILSTAATARIQRLLLLYSLFLGVFLIVAGRLAYVHQRRQRDTQAVRLSEARFRSLFEAVPDGIVIADSNGQLLLVNAQVEKLFGYSRKELIGQKIEILLPEQHRKAQAIYRQLYTRDNTITRPMGVRLELYGRRKDGTTFPAEINVSPLNKKEIYFSIISTIRDISERRKTENKIRALNQKLQQHVTKLSTVNKELEAFSYSVSHDLRAPLRSIDGFSQALLEDYEDKLDREGQGYLQRVRAATQRMGRLIDDLLQLSRISRVEMIPQKVDLSRLAQEIATTLRTEEPQRQVEFCIGQDLTASGDSRLLRILLDNLLGNAWKFSANQPQARITLGMLAKEGKPVFFVRDNGAGFDMRYIDKLFDPFQRLHGANEYPGTGIGLATAQRVVHRHGGQIWAEGQINQEATFYFTL
ncbi:sensor histidine kinase [Nitrosococcus watsonii]|nr:PAS domain S-box protein [Nitrosococcus watsonii]